MTLNCDIGEGEPPARTRALLRIVDLVSIACGGHAGDLRSMNRVVRYAIRCGVSPGAHPGLPNPETFGRLESAISPGALRELLRNQIGTLEGVLHANAADLHHVKLHGALYHQVDHTPGLAEAYLETMNAHFPGVPVIAFSGGLVTEIAPRFGIRIIREAFAERGYGLGGKLIPRGQPGDVLNSLAEISTQVGRIRSADNADTICVHSDHPNAVRIARRVAECIR